MSVAQSLISRPRAVLYGGTATERADLVSLCIRAGLDVTTYVSAAERLMTMPHGTNVLVLVRDSIDHKNLKRAYTLADSLKVKAVKWDRDVQRFAERLVKAGVMEAERRGDGAITRLVPPPPVPPVQSPPPASPAARVDEFGLNKALRDALDLLVVALLESKLYSAAKITIAEDGRAMADLTPRELTLYTPIQAPPQPSPWTTPPTPPPNLTSLVPPPRIEPKEAPLATQVGELKKGQKRRPELLVGLTEALAAYVAGHPGERIEQIAKALGVKTSALKLPMTKLTGAGRVTSAGTRRGTRYFPVAAKPKETTPPT